MFHFCYKAAIQSQQSDLINWRHKPEKKKRRRNKQEKEGRLDEEKIFTVVPFFKNETIVMGGGYFRFPEIWGGVVTLVG